MNTSTLKRFNVLARIAAGVMAAISSFASPPLAQAVVPAPDGGYPGGNTAEGENALLSLTTGGYNTAAGFYALASNTVGSNNTALGAGTLFFNIGHQNTAVGTAALLSNTSGSSNTAVGTMALLSNGIGFQNTANGRSALSSNSEGVANTATGAFALTGNATGNGNTADGNQALQNNTIGSFNTGTGNGALLSNSEGDGNTADGYEALFFNAASANTASGYFALRQNTSGDNNTAVGAFALQRNTTGTLNTGCGTGALYNNGAGTSNTAIGYQSLYNLVDGAYNVAVAGGFNLSSGDFNIVIGNDGVNGDSGVIRIGSTCCQTQAFIAGIHGSVASGGATVYVNSDGQLGTSPSSIRFKDEVRSMDKASEAILALRPVSFRYKKEFDPNGIPQFGLVAEEVEKVNPDLVVHDADGEPYSVRYEQINAMLLNEFLKEHQKVEELKNDFQATVAQQQNEIATLTRMVQAQAAQIEKVSAQLDLTKPPQTVASNH